jgi:starch synthase
MSNQKLRILYASSEINPFLQTSKVADFVRKLPQGIQERGMEIRILVPRFGLINERKNRLHEVVRLSGINIPIGNEEKPLVIKVASIPNAKMQVYFIDNEDYFHRKSVLYDNDNNFYPDNGDRAIFFCKGVLETVKKLGWAPDIVHCHDWMTALIPLYMKTTYKNDPVFKNAKIIFSVYDNFFDHKFGKDLVEKAKMLDVDEDLLSPLKSVDFSGFIQVAANYADRVVQSEDMDESSMKKIFEDLNKDEKLQTIEDGEENYIDSHLDLYNELAG